MGSAENSSGGSFMVFFLAGDRFPPVAGSVSFRVPGVSGFFAGRFSFLVALV